MSLKQKIKNALPPGFKKAIGPMLKKGIGIKITTRL